ncbi:hypothetical protein PoB_002663700 [Plakobranchus ocellatus]|uniref:Uncharacterized protein n=1 Tax=Plakobranchus ocellatus TaxID=259542 RepID=A0AAV3ZZX4_9GAST|nr:hypothetical protein PoB_002663700 [Plakobranchus ocellatus]
MVLTPIHTLLPRITDSSTQFICVQITNDEFLTHYGDSCADIDNVAAAVGPIGIANTECTANISSSKITSSSTSDSRVGRGSNGEDFRGGNSDFSFGRSSSGDNRCSDSRGSSSINDGGSCDGTSDWASVGSGN